MEEQGLAARGNAQAQQLTVAQVVQLLQQGYKPEDLISAGVPRELIEQAIVQLNQQAAGQQAQGQRNQPEGLAGAMIEPEKDQY